ncbi:hypothetical protein WJ86_01190 [Burkholderia multivorans]|nr:hypothetical protein WJ86_01190 [Burkholderia multivorans]KVT37793.1 hypothetical protein WK52_00880 [Burkholderia multivorans]
MRVSRDSRIARRARRDAHARDAMCRVVRACRARLPRRRLARACACVAPRPHAIAARIARMKDLQRAV